MSDKKLSEKITELDALVAWFDRDDIDIDEAIAKFDTVTQLSDEIGKDLAGLENTISVLKKKFNGDT